MQGWLYGKGLIYLSVNISVNKINLLQGQSYSYRIALAMKKVNFVNRNIGR